MQLFENTVKLRGFLGKDAETPPSSNIQEDSFGVLLLATVSGIWDLGGNQWNPRTDWHRVICQGPFFCGMVRGMRRGDYLEVECELRNQSEPRRVVVAGESHMVNKATDTLYAIRIQRLDRPDALVDYGDSDDYNEEVQR